MTSKWLNKTTLEGNIVQLVPLEHQHTKAMNMAIADGELHKLWFTSVPAKNATENYINFALSEYEADRSLPFVVIHKETGDLIGCTRFCNADPANHRAEIGYTWYAKSYQKTAVNTECKLLLLTHAFETLEAIAIEFRTNWHNHASRNAISRLGAKQDGVLRQHQKSADDSYRDTVVFSILNSEWAAVKKNLLFKLESYGIS